MDKQNDSVSIQIRLGNNPLVLFKSNFIIDLSQFDLTSYSYSVILGNQYAEVSPLNFTQAIKQNYVRLYEFLVLDGFNIFEDTSDPLNTLVCAGYDQDTDLIVLLNSHDNQLNRIQFSNEVIVFDSKAYLAFNYLDLDLLRTDQYSNKVISRCQTHFNDSLCTECQNSNYLFYDTVLKYFVCKECTVFGSVGSNCFASYSNPLIDQSYFQESNQIYSNSIYQNRMFISSIVNSSPSVMENFYSSQNPYFGINYFESTSVNITLNETLRDSIFQTGELPVFSFKTRSRQVNGKECLILQPIISEYLNESTTQNFYMKYSFTGLSPSESLNFLLHVPDYGTINPANLKVVTLFEMYNTQLDESNYFIQKETSNQMRRDGFDHINNSCQNGTFIKLEGLFTSNCVDDSMEMKGRRVAYGDLKLIVSCPDNCEECYSYPKCSKCKKGYYVIGGTSVCAPCDPVCVECELYYDQCITTVSTVPYLPVGLVDIPDPLLNIDTNKCVLSSETSEVILVEDPIVPDEPDIQIEPTLPEAAPVPPSVDPQEQVQISQTCLEFVGDKCVTCFPKHVNQDGVCVKCQASVEYFKENSCFKCVSPCAQCESELECTLCNTNYFLKDKKCFRCIDNCKMCEDQTKCLQCKMNFGFDPTDGSCFDLNASSISNQDPSTDTNTENESNNISSPNPPANTIHETSGDSSGEQTNNQISEKTDALENLKEPEKLYSIANCLFQTVTRGCLLCRPTYHIENRTCVSCIKNCLICRNKTSCVKCLPFSKLEIDKESKETVCSSDEVGHSFTSQSINQTYFK